MLLRFETIENKYGPLWVYAPAPWNESVKRQWAQYESLVYENAIVRLLESGRYGCFVDVGAAFGYHARIASRCCRSVLAIESNPLRYGVLLRNLADCANAKTICAYVGERDTKARGPQEIWRPTEREQPELTDIDACPLDVIVNSRNYMRFGVKRTLIKIDVEGNELEVLAGATTLLEDASIEWIVEVHHLFGVTTRQVSDFMTGKRCELIPRASCGLKPDPKGERARYYRFWTQEAEDG
jgi:FkbM family methyltransferase